MKAISNNISEAFIQDQEPRSIGKLLSKNFPSLKDFNFGIILMGLYIVLDFGSLAGMYEDLNYTLRLPFIIALISVMYALFLTFTGKVVFSSTTKVMFFLCLFIILYAAVDTKIPVVKSNVIKVFSYYLANYIIIITCIKTVSQLILLIDIWLASILFSSYHGIMQGGLVWGNPWLRDENEMALLAAMVIPFAFMLFRIYKPKFKRICYLISMASFVTVSVVSRSRGGMLSLGLVFLLCLMLVKHKFRNLLLILTACAMIFIYAPPVYFQEMATILQGTKEGTAQDRIYLWGFAAEMFGDYPIFGIGPHNYSLYFSSYEKGRRYELGALRVPHSTPVQWIAELGLIGTFILLFLLYLMYKNWKIFNKTKSSEEYSKGKTDTTFFVYLASACAISQIGFWFGSLFLSLMTHPFIWILIPFSEAIKNLFEKELKPSLQLK